jgi:sister chromatid cohesion protein DCC1
MPEVEIRFSPEQVATGSFRLLELPPDLCKLIESSADDLRYALTWSMLLYSTVFDACPSLMIKGGPEDDAVLCTSDKTYNIRSVTLSNSVLLVSPSPHIDGSENQVVIQDSLNELLELVTAVPKLHRMNALLKEHEWEEGHEDDDDDGSFRAVSTRDRSYTPQGRGLERLIIFQGEAETDYC